MTLATTTDRLDFSGDGTTTVFPFPYYFLQDSDLVVILRAADGTETTQVMGSKYTVAGATVPTGGTVTMSVSPAVGQQLTIYRDPNATQDVDYVEGDEFPAETHERALDKLTMLVQRLTSKLSRALQLRTTDPTTSGSFDAKNNYIINVKDPVNNQDAATRNYVQTYVSSVIAGITSIVPLTDYGTIPSGTQVRIRRGNVVQTNAFTGAQGELTYNTFTGTVHAHDGSTAGGFPLLISKAAQASNIAGMLTLTKGANIASAATIAFAGPTGNFFHVTGVTGISAITPPAATDAGPIWLIFDGALTLTHGANFLLPGSTNIVTAANDVACFIYETGTSTWRCVNYTRSGASAGGATIPTGTRMLFNQTAAPAGWTKDVSIQDNAALRFTTGAVANNNGVDAFTTVFGASKVTGSHVLTISEMPAHTHGVSYGGNDNIGVSRNGANGATGTFNTASTGGGSGHTHPMTLNLKYHDIIIAQAP